MNRMSALCRSLCSYSRPSHYKVWTIIYILCDETSFGLRQACGALTNIKEDVFEAGSMASENKEQKKAKLWVRLDKGE